MAIALHDPLSKCPVCRALLDEEDLFCANCGTEAPLAEATAHAPAASAQFVATHRFECQGCGASMSYDASAQTLRCPFCGSQRLDERRDARMLRPSRVVPFALAREAAEARLRQWLGSDFWRPGDLAQTAVITALTPVYVPFWVFAANIHTYWTADSSQTPFGARGDWVPLSGENRASYGGVLVGGSSVLAPAETAALAPFDLSTAVPPEAVDLDNIVYEQFRVPRKYARPLAQQGLEGLEREACRRYVPGNCRNLKVNLLIEGLTGEPVLLPVWIMAYQYRGRLFRFLANGQSGRCSGTAPLSYTKIGVATAIVVAIILVIVLLILALAARG
jgi:predicted RNA-binding Zn-ribbon protein involved in translation (DUF1610 family)